MDARNGQRGLDRFMLLVVRIDDSLKRLHKMFSITWIEFISKDRIKFRTCISYSKSITFILADKIPSSWFLPWTAIFTIEIGVPCSPLVPPRNDATRKMCFTWRATRLLHGFGTFLPSRPGFRDMASDIDFPGRKTLSHCHLNCFSDLPSFSKSEIAQDKILESGWLLCIFPDTLWLSLWVRMWTESILV